MAMMPLTMSKNFQMKAPQENKKLSFLKLGLIFRRVLGFF
jgi:hypothetical protein